MPKQGLKSLDNVALSVALDRAEDKLRRQVEKASDYPRRSRPSQANPL